METLSRLPRRLTQLYSDTKVSCEAVIEQDTPAAIPEVNALHRKYRIQKHRLITWGLEWSDNTTGPQADIDESVERAGLTDTVTSVLGTIKEILDEAEKMHPPAVSTGGKSLSGEKSGARPSDPPSWAASDRSRYEDLAKELTTSIDTLYDLSRSRRSQRDGARGLSPSAKAISETPKAQASVFLSPEYNASDVTLINPATLPTLPNIPNVSFRSTLPPKLDPSDLILPLDEPPPYESVGVTSSIRVIGRLRSTHSSTNPWKTDGSKTIETPVLVEYAAFDSAYRATEVSPPTDRLEKLLSILVNLTNEQSFHGTLTCLGYFEDPKQPRFGLVFELPPFVYSGPTDSSKFLEELRPVTLLNVLQTGSKSLHNSNSATPPLEDRFRLAFTLALTFSKIHGEHFVHKDVNSSNILVFRKSRRQSPNSKALHYALRSPVICSFDLFSEYDVEPTDKMPTLNIYRHPEDPKFTGDQAKEYGPQFDLYGLGLILLEIGLWQPLSDLWKAKYTLADFKQRVEEVYIRRLASKCGTAYMQAVRDCFWAADRIASGAESLHNGSDLYSRIRIRLQRCCLLDEDSGDLSSNLSAGPGVAPIAGSLSLKRKVGNPLQAADVPQSPSSTYRSPKRWALEKGSQILKRTESQSRPSPKGSPNPSQLSRSGSRGSQHSIRKSISHSMHTLLSPKEEPTEPMDWRMTHNRDPLEESIYFEAPSTNPTTPPLPEDRGDAFSLSNEKVGDAASVIQRAWRASRTETTPQRSMSLKDYRDKIIIIQKTWRKKKEGRAIQALVSSNLLHWPQATLGFQTTLGYPTPEPEARMVETLEQTERCITSSIQIQTDMEASSRPKLRLHPVKFSPSIVDEWHTNMLPRLERLIERTLKDSEETISIDLVAIGETQASARPTIFVTCTSTSKVKAVLARRFRYDDSVYDLKVRRGKVRRSKLNRTTRRRKLPHRSMMNTEVYNADMQVMNPFHQQRPLCGASIGAYRDEHLPPVSFGGIILADGEPLGMSVHHLLDAPSEDEDSDYGDEGPSPSPNDAILSSANSTSNPWLMGMGSQPGVQIASNSPAPMWELEISDDEDMKSDEDFEAESFDLSSDEEFDSDEDSDENDLADSMTSRGTTGDIDGIPLGEGKDIVITQPAIDDVDDNFFPNEEDRDEDHLDSHELGYVHASSGIRRWKRDGVVHEIDWALLKLNPDRLQPYNLVQGGRRFCIGATAEPEQEFIKSKLEEPVCRRYYKPEEDEYPTRVASASSLGGLRVHCFGRTSGLQGGIVGAAMSSVRIYRRKTFSRSWHVVGGFGVGGDSGAWVIQNNSHRVCGHVLAWCERNNLAYICPMEVLLEDIKRTIGAKRISLPGSTEEALHFPSRSNGKGIADQEFKVEEIEVGVEGLGIVDSAVDMTRPSAGARPYRELPLLVTSGESDKENLPVLRSRVLRMKEGRSGQLEMVTSPVEVGGGRGRGST
ncbi:uncharacterized protein BDR25DRAFT_272081 [Lindgomyces ingoldianus]|uniref:Uncharacterized protein n=1 Tax=Lindgomyces ingoldianus TaxID=673940 RepID=A0ACB6QBS7_9PLEO|nr:uncharacterized protein BDR25DRAFT_272081 [Lindgomyces ingoldianus]KAF2464351.1 hypothetical protein BDR25DRAFT_272081 [Lindgomyces ingoldianus]